jgi:hypothetical protein
MLLPTIGASELFSLCSSDKPNVSDFLSTLIPNKFYVFFCGDQNICLATRFSKNFRFLQVASTAFISILSQDKQVAPFLFIAMISIAPVE